MPGEVDQYQREASELESMTASKIAVTEAAELKVTCN